MPYGFSTTVELMENVPLTPNYEHTVDFYTKELQTIYFNSKVKQSATFTMLSYQRHNSGVIRLQIGMDILDKVNYLRFVNSANENKYFYAFVTGIGYVNENCTEIAYSIDVIQTWMFDYTLNPCYVEREHASTDNVGDNRVDEGLETGEYITAGVELLFKWNFANTSFFLQATQSPIGAQHSSVEGNVYSSLYLKNCPTVAVLENELDAFKNGATQSLDPILSIGQYPSEFWDTTNNTVRYREQTLLLDQTIGFGAFTALDPVTVGTKTYTPKNNKMYCYPYNFMTFESPDGSSNILKYENFRNNNEHKFWCLFSVFPQVESICVPEDYESLNYTINFTHALTCKSYPTCGVASDAYQAWLAQNKYSMPIAMALVESGALGGSTVNSSGFSHSSGKFGGVGGLLQSIKNSASSKKVIHDLGVLKGAAKNLDNSLMTNMITMGEGANVLGDILGADFGSLGTAAKEVGLQLASIMGHKALPDTVATKANAAGVLHNAAFDNYKIYYTKIRPEYAEIIDNYFTCYGYAVKKVKVPATRTRVWWNYVKTVGCTISGNVPAEADEKITAIYDRGVTFWHTPVNMFRYDLDNHILNVGD